MIILKRLVFLALIVSFFAGCQKELNFDGTSIGQLKAALNGTCNPIVINGLYQEDSLLNSDNWIDVQVNASIGGTYEIKSDTVNGFSFYRAGAIPSGLSTIRVFATGTPDTSLPTTFHVYYDSSYCTFTINVVKSTAGGSHYNLGGAPGACSNFSVFGNYNAMTPTNADDSVSFIVSVTTPGTFNITTDTINGMWFSNSGVFINGGGAVETVVLHGHGMPVTASPPAYTFTVKGDGNTCTFPITVLPAGAGSATFTCVSAGTPAGTYTAGTAMNASNTVTLTVNVTNPGTYNITTNTVNNVSFARTGTFTATGNQTVTLIASATVPAAAGTFTYAPSATGCPFPVTYGGTTPPANNEYIPQTIGTNWTDSLDGGASTDTTYYFVSSNTASAGGFIWQKFYVVDFDHSTLLDDSIYHRSTGGKYYRYFFDGQGMDMPLNKEILLLDSSAATGSTWSTHFGPNTVLGGLFTFNDVWIDATFIGKGFTATVNGTTYNNVAKVQFKYYYDDGSPAPTMFAEEEFWYARGYGIIMDKVTDPSGPTTDSYLTKRVQVF